MDELKINVGVGGAAKATADLHGVAAGEHAVGAAAQAASPAIAKTAAAKTAAGEAAEELRMRDRSLLREFAMLSPECAIVAEALNNMMTKTTGAGMVLGFISVAIGAATLAFSKFSEAQAEEKRRTQEVLSGLHQQREAYLALAEAADAAARAKHGGVGVGKGDELSARATMLAPDGVRMSTVKRATQLAGVAGHNLTDTEFEALELSLHLDEEPAGKTDQIKARKILGKADIERLRNRMVEWRRQSSSSLIPARRELSAARTALSPSAAGEDVLALVAQEMTAAGTPTSAEDLRLKLELVAGKARENTVGDEADQAARVLGPMLREHPELGDVSFSNRSSLALFKGIRRPTALPGEEQVPLWQIYGDVVIRNGGVDYNAPHADPAGVVPRNPMKN